MQVVAYKIKVRGTYISNGMDVNVIFRVGGMRDEWLDKEISKHTLDGFDLLSFASTRLDPLTSFGPSFVQGQQAALPSTLDQLIRLGDESGTFL